MSGFCDSGTSSTTNNGWADSLGPSSFGPGGAPRYGATGGPQMRSDVFSYLQNYMPQMTQAGNQYASALQSAASNPGWAGAAQNAQNNISGKYLNGSPELNRALASNQAMANQGAANTVAREKSGMAKAGMGFSTADQQSAQSHRRPQTPS